MENGTELTMEERRVIDDAIRSRYEEREDQRDRVIMELMESLLVAYPRFRPGVESQSDDATAESFATDSPAWGPVERIVDCADAALARYPDDGKAVSRWKVQPPYMLKDRPRDGKDDPSAELDSLSNCVAEYLTAGWARSRTLELWLMRQMIFAEAFAFGREAGRPASFKSARLWWLWAKSMFKWIVGVFVAVAVGEQHGLPVGVLTYVGWLAAVRFLATDTIKRETVIDKVYGAMFSAYTMAVRTVVCPAEVERVVIEAESLGAVWPAGLRSILGRAVARDRAVWT